MNFFGVFLGGLIALLILIGAFMIHPLLGVILVLVVVFLIYASLKN